MTWGNFLFKGRGVIAENILLLKFQKHEIRAILNEEDAVKLVITTSKNCVYTKCSPLLPVATFHWSEIKFLIGIFTGALIMNFIPDWESEIVSKSNLWTYSSESWCYCAKRRALKERLEI